MKNKNLFPQKQLDSPKNYDLCVQVNGVYLDVIRDDLTNLWYIRWNNHLVAEDIVDRDTAIEWCEVNLKNLKLGKADYLPD